MEGFLCWLPLSRPGVRLSVCLFGGWKWRLNSPYYTYYSNSSIHPPSWEESASARGSFPLRDYNSSCVKCIQLTAREISSFRQQLLIRPSSRESWSRPTEPFTISEPRNFWSEELYAVQNRWLVDFEAQQVWNVQSGAGDLYLRLNAVTKLESLRGRILKSPPSPSSAK